MFKTDENLCFSYIKHDSASKVENRSAGGHRTERGARPEGTGWNAKALFPKPGGDVVQIY